MSMCISIGLLLQLSQLLNACENLCTCVCGIAGVHHTWDELYIPEFVTMNACMNACTYCVVLCSTVAALCLNLGAPKVDKRHTHDIYICTNFVL